MQGAHEGAHVGLGERAELDAFEGGQPRPFGEGRAQGVTPVHVVAAVGHHQRDRGLHATGEQIGEQLAGGLVGPVRVLDHDEQRLLTSHLLEHRVDSCEKVGSARTCVAAEPVAQAGQTPVVRVCGAPRHGSDPLPWQQTTDGRVLQRHAGQQLGFFGL